MSTLWYHYYSSRKLASSLISCFMWGSGKSITFLVPVLSSLLTRRDGVALFMYPTKVCMSLLWLLLPAPRLTFSALSHVIGVPNVVSHRRLHKTNGSHSRRLFGTLTFSASSSPAGECRHFTARYPLATTTSTCSHELAHLCSTYDGDTPFADRKAVREEANIILTNPDMVHASMLPHHTSWARVLSRLRVVVLDEAHTYRGVFGAHVAMVLRRLMRLCYRYGSQPQFVCCSATIANPLEHFKQLVSAEHAVVLWWLVCAAWLVTCCCCCCCCDVVMLAPTNTHRFPWMCCSLLSQKLEPVAALWWTVMRIHVS